MSLADIDRSINIRASRERVWHVLTEAGLVEQWLGCIGFKAEIGALFYMQTDSTKRAAGDVTGATHCRIEAIEPPQRLRFSWYLPGTPETHVTIDLAAHGDGSTTARLVHDGWDQFDADAIRQIRDMLDGGWSSFVLPGLQRLAESETTPG